MMHALKNVKNTVEKELENASSSQNVNTYIIFSKRRLAKVVFFYVHLTKISISFNIILKLDLPNKRGGAFESS